MLVFASSPHNMKVYKFLTTFKTVLYYLYNYKLYEGTMLILRCPTIWTLNRFQKNHARQRCVKCSHEFKINNWNTLINMFRFTEHNFTKLIYRIISEFSPSLIRVKNKRLTMRSSYISWFKKSLLTLVKLSVFFLHIVTRRRLLMNNININRNKYT